jgi:DnaJ-class molecular chaperone
MECPYCNGTGKDGSNVCTECNGTGKASAYVMSVIASAKAQYNRDRPYLSLIHKGDAEAQRVYNAKEA